MREVKFRAYLNDYKMVVPVEYINLKHNEIIADIEGEQYEFQLGEYELMQYTGLKDSNGKEIYEGDVVEHMYMVYEGYGNVGEQVESILIKDITKLPFSDASIGCEVLGNIYDNPELL